MQRFKKEGKNFLLKLGNLEIEKITKLILQSWNPEWYYYVFGLILFWDKEKSIAELLKIKSFHKINIP